MLALLIAAGVVIGLVAVLWKLSAVTVDQAHVGVVTKFGRYRRTLDPGLSFIMPIAERVIVKVPVQNQTSQLRFSAITGDQAAVHFTATIIFAVSDHSPDTVQRVAFTSQ